jgi:signal transduction histidine kinase
MNLLINAADALEDKQANAPTIIVTSKVEGAFVILDVADNGPGIASENIERVFDTHFTTKMPGRGSGLGLSLCRSLVERDGGKIAVDSVFGQGTTVVIKLPIPAEV